MNGGVLMFLLWQHIKATNHSKRKVVAFGLYTQSSKRESFEQWESLSTYQNGIIISEPSPTIQNVFSKI